MAGHEIEASKSVYSTTHTWLSSQNNTAPEETEKEKLHKGNVWDYARSMQAGAYMG